VRIATGAVALAGLLATAAPAAPQAPGYRLRGVQAHAHQTAVAVAVRLHAGSQDDQDGREGTAWLLGRVLEAQAVRALADAGSEAAVRVSVERATTLVTVLAFPEDWQAAWAVVDSILFEGALDPAVVEAHRAELAERLAFEAGSPVQDFETEAAGLLAEPGSPFARPVRGTLSSLATLTQRDLAGYRGTHLRRSLAVQAIVGPVPPDAGAILDPPAPAPSRPDGLAWLTGDRRTQVQDVTSTWIQVAYPAPPDLPRTRLELIAHLIGEELDPTPPAPDRYSVDVRLEETPRGHVLVVEAAVFPEATGRWEERITGAVRSLAEEPIPEDFFRWRRRRFRTARLLEEATPEAQAARMTADLLRDGVVRDLGLEIWGLDTQAVGETARALGEPRIFILGPDLAGSHQ
jgi:predicted Zn-dependent peptidase